MMGIRITRDVVLRFLEQLEAEDRATVERFAREGKVPASKGSYALFVDRHEERRLTIDALRALVLKLAPGATLHEGD